MLTSAVSLALLLHGVLAQAAPAPVVGVLVTSRRAGAEAHALSMAQRVHRALLHEHTVGVLDNETTTQLLRAAGVANPRNCAGASQCLAKMAFILGPTAVLVSVDVGKLGGKLAVHLEAVSADQARTVAMVDFTERADSPSDDAVVAMTGFARSISQQLKVPDAPTLAAGAPEPPLTPTASESVPNAQVSVEQPSKLKPALMMGLGGAFAVTAVTFAVLGFQTKATLEGSLFDLDGRTASRFSQPQLDALASRGNTQLTVALISAILSAVATGVATWWFLGDA